MTKLRKNLVSLAMVSLLALGAAACGGAESDVENVEDAASETMMSESM